MTQGNYDHTHHPSPADVLELDAHVFAEHTASITAWLPVHSEPDLIVDLGGGTGAATFALLAQFPRAHVVAVDASTEHLRMLADKAGRHGLADRVHVVAADLDRQWPDLGAPDLVWVSASLHHLDDPDRALGQIRDALAPNGLLAVVELADFPRFLPPAQPRTRPGLEGRCHALSDRMNAGHLRHRGADWAAKLTTAGFTVAAHRRITVEITREQSGAVVDYAHTTLSRVRHRVANLLDPADRTALDRLLDPENSESLWRRADIAMRTERVAWAARANP